MKVSDYMGNSFDLENLLYSTKDKPKMVGLFLEASEDTKETKKDDSDIEDEKIDLLKNKDKVKTVKDRLSALYKTSDEELINGTSSLDKALKICRDVVVVGVIYTAFLGPGLAVLAWIIEKRIKKNINKKQRIEILGKLMSELSIVNEKIEDIKKEPDTPKNRKRKYALMRYKSEIEVAIAKVKSAKVTA